MAATASTMLALGTEVPGFELLDVVTQRPVSPQHFDESAALLVMFLCNHCPYVVHVRDEIGRLANELVAKGVGVIAINANSEQTHPQDGPAEMRALAARLGWTFPFLFDATQSVAKAFRAACTPEFYLFDRARRLVYRGQLDDSRPGNGIPVTGRDLRAAIDALLSGIPVSPEQKPSVGCNIKWSPGNQPDYLR